MSTSTDAAPAPAQEVAAPETVAAAAAAPETAPAAAAAAPATTPTAPAAAAAAATPPTTTTKRSFDAAMAGCRSLPMDQTVVLALIQRVKAPTTGNPKSPYLVFATYMGKKSLLVPFQQRKARDGSSEPKVAHLDDEGKEVRGGVLEPGQTVIMNAFCPNMNKAEEGHIVEFAMSSGVYADPNRGGEERITYKAHSMKIGNGSDCLTDKVYRNLVVGSELAEVPTRFNILPENFPDGTLLEHMTRRFVLPLQVNDQFPEVEIQLQQDRERMCCRKDDTVFVGFNTEDEGKASNYLCVGYNRGEGRKPVLFKLSYQPRLWLAFGVEDLELWKQVASRLVFNCRGGYVYGYSRLDRVLSLAANANQSQDEMQDEGDDEKDILISCGFASRLRIDLRATVRACGIKLPAEWVANTYGPASDYSYSEVHMQHTLNLGWRARVLTNRPTELNLTELSDDQLPGFFKAIAGKPNVEFVGVFDDSSDAPYEAGEENIEKYLAENPTARPAVVYAFVGKDPKW